MAEVTNVENEVDILRVELIDLTTLKPEDYSEDSLRQLLDARGLTSRSDNFDYLWGQFLRWAEDSWKTQEPLPWFLCQKWITKKELARLDPSSDQINRYIKTMGFDIPTRNMVKAERVRQVGEVLSVHSICRREHLRTGGTTATIPEGREMWTLFDTILQNRRRHDDEMAAGDDVEREEPENSDGEDEEEDVALDAGEPRYSESDDERSSTEDDMESEDIQFEGRKRRRKVVTKSTKRLRRAPVNDLSQGKISTKGALQGLKLKSRTQKQSGEIAEKLPHTESVTARATMPAIAVVKGFSVEDVVSRRTELHRLRTALRDAVEYYAPAMAVRGDAAETMQRCLQPATSLAIGQFIVAARQPVLAPFGAGSLVSDGGMMYRVTRVSGTVVSLQFVTCTGGPMETKDVLHQASDLHLSPANGAVALALGGELAEALKGMFPSPDKPEQDDKEKKYKVF
jgi:hypothetical protein